LPMHIDRQANHALAQGTAMSEAHVLFSVPSVPPW
jgi:hypothetical protein